MPFLFEEYIEEARKKQRSEAFIESTVQYAKKLDDNGLPVIFSRAHFASLVGMPSREIFTILHYRVTQYVQFSIKKKNGGLRHIMTPEKKLLYLQKWINKNILQQVSVLDCCTAFVPGTSLATNAYTHRNAHRILKVDLTRFFDTINEKRVFGLFKYLGYHPNVAYDLAQLTTAFPSYQYWKSQSLKDLRQTVEKITFYDAFLPQGAPTSPQLANLIAKPLDSRLLMLSEKFGCRYSRYADDLVFSTNKPEGKLPPLHLVKRIIESEGFLVNEDKTAYLKKGMKQYVTGLTVTHGFHVSKKQRQEIYKHLYYARKYGPFEHLKRWTTDNWGDERKTPYGFKDWLLGKISFINSIDRKNGIRMLDEFNKIHWGFECEDG
ncbi:MAG TPA: hypothetical protein DHW64_01075 [Chitinophagaceae bacterium]|nr:hypothetical protein [Chitinophagaceae bacterium]